MTQRSRPSPYYRRIISNIDHGSINILVVTETPSKLAHIHSAIEGHGLPTGVHPFCSLVDGPGAPENKGRYRDNVEQKIDTAHEALRAIGEEEQAKRAQALGLNLRRSYLVGEDSGFGFLDPGLRYEPEFLHLSNVLTVLPGPDDPWPGVETKPIIMACGGTANFFALIGAVKRRRKVDPHVVCDSWMIATPLKHPSWKTVSHGQIFSTFLTESHLVSEANIEDFLIPDVACNPDGLTETALARAGRSFKIHESPKAKACQAMIRKLGIESALPLGKRYPQAPLMASPET